MADIKTLQEVLIIIKQLQKQWAGRSYLALQDAYESVDKMIHNERDNALTELVKLGEELGLYDDLKEPTDK